MNAPQSAGSDFQDPLENYEARTFSDPVEQALGEGLVSEIQSQPFAAVSPDTTVEEALHKLVGKHIACLLVEDDGLLVGVFSDRDVLDRAALEYDDVKSRPVKDLMATDPVYVHESDTAAAALAVMAVSGYRHVPVVNEAGNLTGIISPHRMTEYLHTAMSQEDH